MIADCINQIDEAFACRQHVIFTGSTEDRVYHPDLNIGPANLDYGLAQHFGEQGFQTYLYSQGQGVRRLSPEDGSSDPVQGVRDQDDPVAVLNFIASIMRNHDEPCRVLIKYPEHLAPGNQDGAAMGGVDTRVLEGLHNLARDDGIASGPSRLGLIVYSGQIHELLAKSPGFRIIELKLPDYGVRKAFLEFLIAQGVGKLSKGLSPARAARLTKGMPLIAIEQLMRSASVREMPASVRQISKAKAAAIKCMAGGLLEVSEPKLGLDDLAGHHNWKDLISELSQAVAQGKKDVPQAILLQGTPGNGKSYSARILAGVLGWPLLIMRNVRSPYVGQSEINLERMIAIIERLAPVVVFLDEIDQLLGQRNTGSSGDSGTSARMLSRILEWLGELHLRGKVIFLAATNMPHLLDPAILDRFGISIPFVTPGLPELLAMAPLACRRINRKLTEDALAANQDVLAKMLLSGREFQEVLINAGRIADMSAQKSGALIGPDHFGQALLDHIPRQDPMEIELIELTALAYTSRQDLLPWIGSQGLRSGVPIPKRFLGRGVVAEDGRLKVAQLHQELNRLKQLRSHERLMR